MSSLKKYFSHLFVFVTEVIINSNEQVQGQSCYPRYFTTNLGSPATGKSVLCQVYASKGIFTSDYNMVTFILFRHKEARSIPKLYPFLNLRKMWNSSYLTLGDNNITNQYLWQWYLPKYFR